MFRPRILADFQWYGSCLTFHGEVGERDVFGPYERERMAVAQQRTPGITMTEPQLFSVLEELHVLHVTRPDGGRVTLVCRQEDQVVTYTVTDIKEQANVHLAELEERKKEIEENQFALPLEGEIATRGDHLIRVRYSKRNDQLSPEEVEEKQRLLRQVMADMAHQRLIIGGMNYLQVHYRDLQPRLIQRTTPLEGVERRDAGGRRIWTRGIKSAALFCIKEGEKPSNAGRPGIDLCREFFMQYALEDEEGYTPEMLYRNVQQILRLDRNEE